MPDRTISVEHSEPTVTKASIGERYGTRQRIGYRDLTNYLRVAKAIDDRTYISGVEMDEHGLYLTFTSKFEEAL